MRQVLGFVSFIALAIIAAVALGVAGLGPLANSAGQQASSDAFTLDLRSLIAGTVLGVMLSSLGQLSWADMPRRVIAWLYANERRIIRCGYAAVFLAVLMFY